MARSRSLTRAAIASKIPVAYAAFNPVREGTDEQGETMWEIDRYLIETDTGKPVRYGDTGEPVMVRMTYPESELLAQMESDA